MASATTNTAPVAPEVLAKPAARLLSEALGDRVLAIEDFRGDLAITVGAHGLGRGGARSSATAPISTTSSSSTSAASTSWTARTGPSASRSCCTSTRSPTSTTSA